MKNIRKLVGFAASLGMSMAATGAVVFTEDFESYAVDTSLHGQGGWKGWDNNPAAAAVVSMSPNGTQGVNITGAADLVHEFPYTSGQYRMSIDQYVSSTATGETYLLLLNRYSDGVDAPKDWSIQSHGLINTQQWVAEGGSGGVGATGATATMITDQWVTWVFEIDLSANSVQEFYNGAPFGPAHAWQATGDNALAAIDLYSQNSGNVFYDNLVIEQIPEPDALLLVGLTGAALVFRRRAR